MIEKCAAHIQNSITYFILAEMWCTLELFSVALLANGRLNIVVASICNFIQTNDRERVNSIQQRVLINVIQALAVV